jgi:hypothetical protein
MPMHGSIGILFFVAIFFHFVKNIMEKTPFYHKFPFGGEKKHQKMKLKK